MNIVADIGGSKMRVAVVAGDSLGEIRKIQTPKDFAEGVAAFTRLAHECTGGKPVSALVGCVAGSVDEHGIISNARNLRAWEGMNITEALSRSLHAPVQMVNDAALAGLGEAHFGAGRGASRLVYVTVSTGVGGALIVGDAIEAAGGIASIRIDGSDLENLVSGTAVAKKFGIHPKDLTSLEERDKLADILARGLQTVIKQWSPERIVLGGSMIVGMNAIPIARVQTTLDTLLADGKARPTLKMAELGDNGGLWGGLARLQTLTSSS